MLVRLFFGDFVIYTSIVANMRITLNCHCAPHIYQSFISFLGCCSSSYAVKVSSEKLCNKFFLFIFYIKIVAYCNCALCFVYFYRKKNYCKMADAAKPVGRPMKFPYTFSAKIAQFPLKFYIQKQWIWRYYGIALVFCAPVFYKISKLGKIAPIL